MARNGHKHAEAQRLAHSAEMPWRKWGPYLSERQWGTVREDYSAVGDAWNYFTPRPGAVASVSLGRGRAGGHLRRPAAAVFCARAVERQGPDSQGAAVRADQQRGQSRRGREGVLLLPRLDADALVHEVPLQVSAGGLPLRRPGRRPTASAAGRTSSTSCSTPACSTTTATSTCSSSTPRPRPRTSSIQITVHNRGPEAATLHVLPTLWFRNTWSWDADAPRPALSCMRCRRGSRDRVASARSASAVCSSTGAAPTAVHRERDQHRARSSATPNATPYVKDGINDYVVHGRSEAVNPGAARHEGGGALRASTIPPGGEQVLRLRLQPTCAGGRATVPASAFGRTSTDVHDGAPARGGRVLRGGHPRRRSTPTTRNVMRQALAGMLWSKQFYNYDVDRWLAERGADPFTPARRATRNDGWHHMDNADIISMPDKWEYPWYAAWDLAFHVLALTLVDADFGKQQLDLMLQERYLHPNGQIPAYEWNFGDVNPPVHAWSTIFTYRLEKARRGQGDVEWLERSFHKLLLNFTWWVNRKDRAGKQRVRGRLPRPRQHRRVRSQLAAADRRLPGAGGRHRLDGAVLPEHARDRRRAGAENAGLRRHGA